ncbi:hypothetical protein [Duganella sp. Root1480D1]|uniref:hypothetical protein n=1 Tax=Duganella sp. Root1480D1 TaxID=1736471 RepID=UPI000ACFEE8D|nr:hypothetical protein [Duganella sp. Root1480D1]
MNKLVLLGAALMLAACTKKAEPPAVGEPASASAAAVAVEAKPVVDPKTARMMELLRVVYGDKAAHENYLDVELPDVEKRDELSLYRLEPVAMRELPDGRAVVVANAQMVDSNGDAMAYHVSTGLLSAYILRRDGDKWKVEARHENVASLGSSGTFGEVEWVALGEGKPGFIVQHGGIWQGYSINLISVFDLADGSLHDLAGDVSLSSENEGACGEETSRCWSVEGKWKFEKREGAPYDDLVLRFTGYDEERAENASETEARKRKDVAGMARYKFDGGRYVLVEGENIVPGV